jgi:hypothetical protein
MKSRILISGMIAGDPGHGGATWAVLQYVLGLRELGHDVYLVEPVQRLGIDSVRYFRDVVSRFDLSARAALLHAGTTHTVGLSYQQLRDVAAGADILLNVSGMLSDAALIERIPVRVYLDLDPAFNQMWQAWDGIDMRFDAHTHFVTVGLNVGQPDCVVPTCGREWLTTVPPVVLSQWPCRPFAGQDLGWTTVASWRGYGSIRRNGAIYGQKAHSMRRVIDLPQRTTERLQLAIGIDPGETRDLDALAAHDWQLLDPRAVAATPEDYQRFIQQSKGELGIAKSGYIESRSGWFSDRSVCYLASGRPVVAQDTGFSRALPTGEGLFAFASTDEAAAFMEAASGDYVRHSRRARELAESLFASGRVLASLIARVATACRAVHD